MGSLEDSNSDLVEQFLCIVQFFNRMCNTVHQVIATFRGHYGLENQNKKERHFTTLNYKDKYHLKIF